MCRILIVEDEDRLAAFIEKGLQKQGFRTSIATDGQKALLMTQDQQFDLLLLDLGLPVMNGWTVLKELRSQRNPIPVIIMTAWDQRETKSKGQRYKVNGYISKPFRFQDLLRQVNIYLPQVL